MDSTNADAWWHFQQRLGGFLRAMHDTEVLALDVEGASGYVQFMSWGDQGVHGEVSQDTGPAGEPVDQQVLALGWEPPMRDRRGRSVTGTDNLQIDVPPEDAHRLAAMTVAVLHDAWGLSSPNALSAKKVIDAGGPAVEVLQLPTG